MLGGVPKDCECLVVAFLATITLSFLLECMDGTPLESI